jgi:uncharacterized protein with HEPN domain
MRHVLVHDYFDVDWNEVYQAAVRDVPALRAPLEDLIRSLPPEPP